MVGVSGLAQRQAELVAALVTGGPVPAGLDPGRVRIAENALLRKRSGEAAAHAPRAAHDLGERFHELFADWARGRERFGAHAEAEAFTAHLTACGHWQPPVAPTAGRSRWRRRR